MKPVRILLVEDSFADAELFSRALAGAGIGCVIERTETESDFLRGLEHFSPDLIASDFSMPRFDGMSALALARSNRPDLPFIFVSGTIGEEAAIRALTSGAADYVLKGNLKRLPSAINRVLQEASIRRSSDEALQDANRRYHGLINLLQDAVLIILEEAIVFANEAAVGLYGADSPDRLLGRHLAEFVHDESLGNSTVRMRRPPDLGARQTFIEQKHVRLDGTIVYVEVMSASIDYSDRPAVLAVIRDVTERNFGKETQAQLAAKLQEYAGRIGKLNRIRTVLSSINGAILRTRDRQSLLHELCRIAVDDGKLLLAWVSMVDDAGTHLQFQAHAGKGRECFENLNMPLAPPEDEDIGPTREAVIQNTVVVWDNIQDDTSRPSWQARARLVGYRSLIALPLRVAGQVVGAWTLCSEENGFFTDEERKLLVELASDVGLGLDYFDKSERLEDLAYHDQLTGLPNPALVEDRLEQAIGRARHSKRLVAAIAVHIEGVRRVNDLLGWSAGDTVMRSVAAGLSSSVRSGDTIGRLGQHEFVVVLVDIAQPADLPVVLRNLAQAIPQTIQIEEKPVSIRPRMGVAIFPRDGRNAEELIRNASLAAGEMSSGKATDFAFYSSSANELAQRNFQIGQELRHAIEREELYLDFQPIVHMSDRRIVATEALLRWNSKKLGKIRPDQFIPIAEESDLIHKIGIWVVEEAARLSCVWKRDLDNPPRISVNVSAHQLRKPGLADLVIRLAREASDLDAPAKLGIEITESAVMDNIELAVSEMQKLKDAGFRISIDDFGTGYSSLSRLRVLPIDNLKIDKSFVHDLETDPDAVLLAKSIIALAHSLNLGVVAEGIETEAQFGLLNDLGCDAGQGYLLGRPMHTDLLLDLLRKGGG